MNKIKYFANKYVGLAMLALLAPKLRAAEPKFDSNFSTSVYIESQSTTDKWVPLFVVMPGFDFKANFSEKFSVSGAVIYWLDNWNEADKLSLSPVAKYVQASYENLSLRGGEFSLATPQTVCGDNWTETVPMSAQFYSIIMSSSVTLKQALALDYNKNGNGAMIAYVNKQGWAASAQGKLGPASAKAVVLSDKDLNVKGNVYFVLDTKKFDLLASAVNIGDNVGFGSTQKYTTNKGLVLGLTGIYNHAGFSGVWGSLGVPVKNSKINFNLGVTGKDPRFDKNIQPWFGLGFAKTL